MPVGFRLALASQANPQANPKAYMTPVQREPCDTRHLALGTGCAVRRMSPTGTYTPATRSSKPLEPFCGRGRERPLKQAGALLSWPRAGQTSALGQAKARLEQSCPKTTLTAPQFRFGTACQTCVFSAQNRSGLERTNSRITPHHEKSSGRNQRKTGRKRKSVPKRRPKTRRHVARGLSGARLSCVEANGA